MVDGIVVNLTVGDIGLVFLLTATTWDRYKYDYITHVQKLDINIVIVGNYTYHIFEQEVCKSLRNNKYMHIKLKNNNVLYL